MRVTRRLSEPCREVTEWSHQARSFLHFRDFHGGRYAFAEQSAGSNGDGDGDGSACEEGADGADGGAAPCYLRTFGEWTDDMPCVEPVHRPLNFRRRYARLEMPSAGGTCSHPGTPTPSTRYARLEKQCFACMKYIQAPQPQPPPRRAGAMRSRYALSRPYIAPIKPLYRPYLIPVHSRQRGAAAVAPERALPPRAAIPVRGAGGGWARHGAGAGA